MHKFFDWQTYFYNYVDPAEAARNFLIIEPLLKVDQGDKMKWADRIRKRGQVFFMIVKSWVAHITKVMYVERAITWANIPGYK